MGSSTQVKTRLAQSFPDFPAGLCVEDFLQDVCSQAFLLPDGCCVYQATLLSSMTVALSRLLTGRRIFSSFPKENMSQWRKLSVSCNRLIQLDKSGFMEVHWGVVSLQLLCHTFQQCMQKVSPGQLQRFVQMKVQMFWYWDRYSSQRPLADEDHGLLVDMLSCIVAGRCCKISWVERLWENKRSATWEWGVLCGKQLYDSILQVEATWAPSKVPRENQWPLWSNRKMMLALPDRVSTAISP